MLIKTVKRSVFFLEFRQVKPLSKGMAAVKKTEIPGFLLQKEVIY